MLEAVVLVAVGLLAYANGANDNFKGVATLYGSGTTGYRGAVVWATLTTLAGALAAALLAGRLTAIFSGKGLVPDALTGDPRFLVAAGTGAAGAVLVATRAGLPVSTTHALLGGLLGAGFAAARGTANGGVNVASLGRLFVLPLAASPLLALAATRLAYPLLRSARLRLGVKREMCLCLGGEVEPVSLGPGGAAAVRRTGVGLSVKELSACRERYVGTVLGFDARRVLDRVHFLSAGAVGFARGMNDAPKILAILVAARLLGPGPGLALVALVMAAGGLFGARRLAETLAHRITAMNHGQAFTANAITALLVLAASRSGLPVSTTHVAVGALAGIGIATGQARWRTIATIGLAWVTTLPVAAALGAGAYAVALRLAC